MKKNLRRQFQQGAANQNIAHGGFLPRTEKQKLQAALIDADDVTFSIGPAGTGKTHVAMAKAVEALRSGAVDTILLTRPAVEAGETIGFLPGDQNDKMDPYMRPLYDELDKAFGRGKYKEMIRSKENPEGVIEVAPIGTMRGRTFAKAFVVIDEAQNLLLSELVMALTRLGPGSKMVVTGDPGQIDLSPESNSGLMKIIGDLDGLQSVAVQHYGPEDVVRHPTVQRIVERLEEKGKAIQQDNKSAPSPKTP